MPELQTAPDAKPQVLSGVAPYFTVSDASAAAELYAKAFGAEEVARAPSDDGKRLLHLHLHINGGSLMLMDVFPEYGAVNEPPRGAMLHLQVDDIETWFKRAADAGLEVKMAPQKMFWGDLYAQVQDRFGILWSFGQTEG
jgi:uncharacterized glyoxalase superfamily protein PhnB